VHSTEIT